MDEIIELINRNAEIIVDNIEQESIDVYNFLKGEFEKSNVTRNHLFQFVFRSFYRLDNAGLTPEFKNKYFQILQSSRSSNEVDIKQIAKELYEYPNRKGQKSLQFSFTTKLINTIDDSKPIYDSAVSKLYGFKAPSNNKNFADRLEEYMNFYSLLNKSYQTILDENSLSTANDFFEEKTENSSILSDIKKLDFLMWSAGKLKGSGKI